MLNTVASEMYVTSNLNVISLDCGSVFILLEHRLGFYLEKIVCLV